MKNLPGPSSWPAFSRRPPPSLAAWEGHAGSGPRWPGFLPEAPGRVIRGHHAGHPGRCPASGEGSSGAGLCPSRLWIWNSLAKSGIGLTAPILKRVIPSGGGDEQGVFGGGLLTLRCSESSVPPPSALSPQPLRRQHGGGGGGLQPTPDACGPILSAPETPGAPWLLSARDV